MYEDEIIKYRKKILFLLQEDQINQEEIFKLPLKYRLWLLGKTVNQNASIPEDYFYYLCIKKQLFFLKTNEIHQFLNTDVENMLSFLEKGYDYKNIQNLDDYIHVLSGFSNRKSNIYNWQEDFYEKFGDEGVKKLYLYFLEKKYDTNFLYPVISIVLDDSIILHYLENYKIEDKNQNNYQKALLLTKLHDDLTKKEFLSQTSYKYRYLVIKSFQHDEDKIPYINLMNKEKGEIILSLQNEESRDLMLSKYFITLTSNDKIDILLSLKDLKRHPKYLKRLMPREKIEYYAQMLSLYKEKDEIKKIKHKSLIPKFLDSVIVNDLEPSMIIYAINNIPSNRVSYEKLENIFEYISCSNEVLQDILNQVLPRFNEKYRKLVLKNKLPLEVVLNNLKYIKNTKNKLEILESGRYLENNLDYIYDSKYDDLIKEIARYYNFKEENLLELTKRLGCSILRNLENNNIKKILKLEDPDFQKILLLLDPKLLTLDIDSTNNILNVMLKRTFNRENNDVIEIFHNCLEDLASKNREGLIKKIGIMAKKIDLYKFLAENQTDLFGFINDLFNGSDVALNNLKKLTSMYITFNQDEYVQNNMIKNRSSFLEEKLNINQSIKYIFKNNSKEKIISVIKEYLYKERNNFSKKSLSEYSLLYSDEILERLISFKIDPINNKKPNNLELHVLDLFLKENIESLLENRDLFLNKFNIDRETVVSNHSRENAITILKEIDPNLLVGEKKILNDSSKFQILMEYLQKYKLFAWGDNISDLGSNANVLTEPFIVSSFITYFSKIYDIASKRKEEELLIKKDSSSKVNLTLLLDIASCYAKDFQKYIKVFGKENFRLLLSDPSPYSSSLSKKEKLDRVVNLYQEMYKRTTSPVPPIDKVYKLQNDKEINIIVGNVTNPINLTLGERTFSCMREGGYADSLYNFANTNKNGFHIRFHNPKNGNLISRVTGFRNGNTVFLNELRYSLDSRYTTLDIIEACFLVARDLIKKSDEQLDNICNVLITNEYAMSSSKKELCKLNCPNITKGLGEFYTDYIKDTVICLASKNNENILPIVLENEHGKYPLQRDKIRLFSGEELMEEINRLDTMDELLKGKKLFEIHPSNYSCVKEGYIGDDFYVLIFEDGKILEKILCNRQLSKVTLKEVQEVLKKIAKEQEKKEINIKR